MSIAIMIASATGNAAGWDLSGDNWVSPSKRVANAPPSSRAVDKSTRQPKEIPPRKATAKAPAGRVTDFDKAINAKDIGYALQGLNNDTEMLLTLRNLTGGAISLVVPQGIVFLPARSSLQRMLLRADVPFAIPAGKSVAHRIPVLCMDIAKSPPGTRDTVWAHSFDAARSRLVAYTRQKAAEEARRRSDATQEQIERFFLRFVLWRYNGATQEDFASFIRKYGSAAEKGTASHRSTELLRMADTIIAGFRRTQKEGGE